MSTITQNTITGTGTYEDAPPAGGLAGVIEYWRSGCWREYGWRPWLAVLNVAARHRAS
jgi:hypothetical protein